MKLLMSIRISVYRYKQYKNMKKEDPFSIFIADNNEIDRFLLQSQLETFCKNLTLVADGKEALNYLQHNKYDLIFVDLQLPFLSGLELVKIIKTADSINKDSVVIAIAEYAEQDQEKMLLVAGFDECLIKPVLLEELTEILNLYLGESPQQDNIYLVALLKKTAGNKKLAATIFYKLFAELPQQTKAIENALMSDDFNLAQQITHKLHGSVSFCGFIELQTKANNLENSLADNNALINKHFLALKNDISAFIASKTSLLNQLDGL